jgi:hypothetical protein
MGWSLPRAERIKIFKQWIRYYRTNTDEHAEFRASITVLVIDINSLTLSKCHYKTDSHGRVMSPREAAKLLIQNYVAPYTNLKTVLFALDSSDRTHELRQKFSAKKYSGPQPAHAATAADVDAMTIDHMPVGYDAMWLSVAGKRKLHVLITQAIREIVTAYTDRYCRYIIDPASGPIVYIPDQASDDNPHNFGEADLKVSEFVKRCPKTETILVWTNDWDMPLQLLAHETPNCLVMIASFYMPPDHSVSLHKISDAAAYKTKHKIACHKYDEIIDSGMVAKTHTFHQRLQLLFWCLCANGVDYCDGLGRWGYSKSKIVPIIMKRCNAGICVKGKEFCGPRTLRWYPTECMAALKTQKRIRKTLTSEQAGKFHDEFDKIIMTMLYWLAWNPLRPRAGPLLLETRLDAVLPSSHGFRPNGTPLVALCALKVCETETYNGCDSLFIV